MGQFGGLGAGVSGSQVHAVYNDPYRTIPYSIVPYSTALVRLAFLVQLPSEVITQSDSIHLFV